MFGNKYIIEIFIYLLLIMVDFQAWKNACDGEATFTAKIKCPEFFGKKINQ